MENILSNIEPHTVIEWVIYTILWIIAAVVVAKLYVYVQDKKRRDKNDDEIRDMLKKLIHSNKLIMRDRMSDECEKYRKKGFVSNVEFEDMTEHYESYKELYGNSWGDSIYDEIKDIHRKSI